VHVIHPDDAIAHAAMMFTLYGVRRLPVVQDGELVGIVTRRDLLRHVLAGSGALSDPLVELIPAVGDFAR
jgi:CBS domain-containing protein